MPLSPEYTSQKEGMKKKTEMDWPGLPALNLYCVLTIVRLDIMFEENDYGKLKLFPDLSSAVLTVQ